MTRKAKIRPDNRTLLRTNMIDIVSETSTLIELAWNTDIDEDTRDSMRSHFEFMEDKDWEALKTGIIYSESVKRIIDTIDTLREMK
jgi:hypothetical protein